MHIHIHTCVYAHICMHMCTNTHAHIHTHACTCTHCNKEINSGVNEGALFVWGTAVYCLVTKIAYKGGELRLDTLAGLWESNLILQTEKSWKPLNREAL